MKIAILSDGGFGTALAVHLSANHHVRQWGPFPDYIQEMRHLRRNPRYLPKVVLPDNIELYDKIEEAMDGADILLLATPSQFLRGVLKTLKPYYLPEHQTIVNVAKGIEIGTHLRMSQVVEQEIGRGRYVVLSGPSHAEEVSRKVPTAVVCASYDPLPAQIIQNTFQSSTFRVYTSSDMVGVELGGSLKNIFAIAAGIVDGMGLGDNPKAALITRGIAEMARFGEAFGGAAETFSGLSGVGDMIVTCCSGHSRNRHVGEELGRGKTVEEALASLGMQVAEGVDTCRSVWELARKGNIDTPIIDEMYAILFEGKKASDALWSLMNRAAKPE